MEAFAAVRAPKLVATLAAVTEVVQAQLSAGTVPTGTHYFGALMSGLEGAGSTGHWAELLKLLSLLLARNPTCAPVGESGCSVRWVPASVLRSRFSQAMQVFASVLQRGTGLGPSVLRPLVLCIGSVLAQQDPAPDFWKIPVNKRALMNVAELLVDERPKIRRAANDAISDILEDQRAAGGVAASYCVVEFCEQIILDATLPIATKSSSGGASDSKRQHSKRETMALQMISFVTRNCKFMSIKSLHKLIMSMSSLVRARTGVSISASSRETPLLVTKALHNIICNLQAPIDPSTLLEVLNSLLRPWNSKSGDDIACATVNAVADGISRIAKATSSQCEDDVRRRMAIDLLPRALSTLCGFFHSTSARVLDQAASACARIIVNCVDERLVVETNRVISTPSAENRIALPLETVINSLETLMQPHLAHAWPHALPLVAGLFRHLGERASPVAGPILRTAASLLDDHRAEVQPSAGVLQRNTSKVGLYRAGVARGVLQSGIMREQLKDVVGAAVESMGASAFFQHVPIGNPSASTSAEVEASMTMLERRLWVLPVLKQHVRRTRSQLACFHTVIVKMAILCEGKAKSHEQVGSNGLPSELTQGKGHGKLPGQQIADVMRTRSMQLWELFGSFCVCPTDAKTYFSTISATLGYALRDRRYPALQRNVCVGLATLIKRQFRAANPELESRSPSLTIADDDGDEYRDDDKEEGSPPVKFSDDIGMGGDGSLPILCIPAEEARTNIAQIAKYASRFLPLLFTQYELMHTASREDGAKNATMEAILAAATEYCKLAEQKFINKIATTLMTKLLKATTATDLPSSDIAFNAAALMGLSLAVVQSPQLSGSVLHMFFRTLRPLISGEENNAIQKRAYKVLAVLCENHVSRAIPNHAEWSWLEELASLLRESLLTVSSTVKRHRLRCLSFIVKGIDPRGATGKTFIVSMVSEVILCTKESNARTREAAFDVLVSTARCMASVGLLDEMLNMVIAGLAAKTSHMRSATVFALSRLLYEFTSSSHEGLNDAKMGELVLTVCVLLHEKAREVVKAVIGFVKVVSVRFSTGALTPLVPTIVTGLMKWAADSKNRFRQRIRVILERLIRRVGYDAIAAHVPATDAKLMAHIARMKSRKERNRERKRNDQVPGEIGGELSQQQSRRLRKEKDGATYQELLMDSDEEEGEGEAAQEEDSSMLLRDDGDAPINLLDTNSAMHLVTGASASAAARNSEKHSRKKNMELDQDGRMIVAMEGHAEITIEDDHNSKAPKLTPFDELRHSAAHEDTSVRPSKRRKGKGNDDLNGSRFKSSKSGGDVRRKGDKLLPFAYVQMGSNFLNQRKKRQNIREFEQLTAGNGRGTKGKRKR